MNQTVVVRTEISNSKAKHRMSHMHSRLAVVVGAMVVGGGGRPAQVTLRSPSVPVDLKVKNPGWLVEMWLLIQV